MDASTGRRQPAASARRLNRRLRRRRRGDRAEAGAADHPEAATAASRLVPRWRATWTAVEFPPPTVTGSAASRAGRSAAAWAPAPRRSDIPKVVQSASSGADTRSVSAADGIGKDYIAGMTIPELVSKYGMSERAVWKRVTRYRRKLLRAQAKAQRETAEVARRRYHPDGAGTSRPRSSNANPRRVKRLSG